MWELFVHRARPALKQRQASSVIGPSTWNRFPLMLRLLPRNNASSFYKVLKSYLFGCSWTEVGFFYGRYINLQNERMNEWCWIEHDLPDNSSGSMRKNVDHTLYNISDRSQQQAICILNTSKVNYSIYSIWATYRQSKRHVCWCRAHGGIYQVFRALSYFRWVSMGPDELPSCMVPGQHATHVI